MPSEASSLVPSLAPIIDYLRQRAGVYQGEGVNHEGEPFLADFNLKMIAGGHGGQISFRARDRDVVFHEERTWIAHDLMHDRVCLWTISTNTPGVLRLDLRKDAAPAPAAAPTLDDVERTLVFGVGEPAHADTFREEIELEFRRDGSLGYVYSWGVPGEGFGVRSRARLVKQERALPPSWL